jgi:predicted RNA-binding protein with PUA-like domain
MHLVDSRRTGNSATEQLNHYEKLLKMNYWLMKSEPDTFSIDHLMARPNQTEHWDGVRNYQVRNMIRDLMKQGDRAFFYHSSCKVPAIVGIVEIVRSAYPDHTAFDPDSPYYDPSRNGCCLSLCRLMG